MSRSPAKRHTSSASSQWYFTKAEILSSPSVREGLNPQEEKTNRSKGCLFMEVVGQKLRLHLYTVSTACMFFHRFYMRQAMKLFHHYVRTLNQDMFNISGTSSDMFIPCHQSRRESQKVTRFDCGCDKIQSEKLGTGNRCPK